MSYEKAKARLLKRAQEVSESAEGVALEDTLASRRNIREELEASRLAMREKYMR